jgi:hypothetical protein
MGATKMGFDLQTFVPYMDHRWIHIANTKPDDVIFTTHEDVLLGRVAAQTLKVVTDRGEVTLTPEHQLLVYMMNGKGPKWLAGEVVNYVQN